MIRQRVIYPLVLGQKELSCVGQGRLGENWVKEVDVFTLS